MREGGGVRGGGVRWGGGGGARGRWQRVDVTMYL